MEADAPDRDDSASPSDRATGNVLISAGGYRVILAANADEVASAQALRARSFGLSRPLDQDRHDPKARHYLIYDDDSGLPVCCFRLRVLTGAALADSYAAGFYDLDALAEVAAPMLEIGRFCLAPGHHSPDLIRLAWAAITETVDAEGIGLLFGCSSFAGTDPEPYAQAFAHLKANHQAPAHRTIGQKAAEVFDFDAVQDVALCPQTALRQLPPLLRSYLSLGAWVSDHAVIDRQMNTLHVFTCVEVDRIPPARQRLLRSLLGDH